MPPPPAPFDPWQEIPSLKRSLALCVVLFCLAACDSTGDHTAKSTDGVLVHYEIHGAGEPTVLLIHGWANDRTYWQPHMASLARTFRVVAVDLPGFATSAGARTTWSINQLGTDVASVVRQLAPSPIVVVGFSMGAAVALETGRQIPDLVRGIVTVDAFHDPHFKFTEALAQQLLPAFREKWGDSAYMRSLVFSAGTPDTMLARYMRTIAQPFPERWWPALMAVWDWNNTQLTTALTQLRVPVAAINSAQPATNIVAWREYVPGFTVAIIPDVGHMGMIWEKIPQFDSLVTEAARRFAR
jgi:pimeloyl-ACP methyl ester carboxylesterase